MKFFPVLDQALMLIDTANQGNTEEAALYLSMILSQEDLKEQVLALNKISQKDYLRYRREIATDMEDDTMDPDFIEEDDDEIASMFKGLEKKKNKKEIASMFESAEEDDDDDDDNDDDDKKEDMKEKEDKKETSSRFRRQKLLRERRMMEKSKKEKRNKDISKDIVKRIKKLK